MRVIRNVFFGLGILTFASAAAFYVFFESQGAAIIQSRLEQELGRPVRISRARWVFPLGLRLDDIDIFGSFKAGSMRARFGLPLFGDRRLILPHVAVYDAQVTLVKTSRGFLWAGLTEIPSPQSSTDVEAAVRGDAGLPAAGRAVGGIDGIVIERVEVEKGRLIFLDPAAEAQEPIIMEDMHFTARDVGFPLLHRDMAFSLSALAYGGSPFLNGSRIAMEGSVNWPERNMDALLKMALPHGMGILAELKSQNNALNVHGKLDLKEADSAIRQESGLADFFLSSLKSAGVNMGLSFSFQTMMDDFRVEHIPFMGELQFGGAQQDTEVIKDIGRHLRDLSGFAADTPSREGSPATP